MFYINKGKFMSRSINYAVEDKNKPLLKATSEAKTTFSMSLTHMPIVLRTKFKRLKTEGKITGSFNAYLRQAVIDKLKIDDID